MHYISVKEFAKKHGLSTRTVCHYCALGKIEGAFLTGRTWAIPIEATLPTPQRTSPSPLLLRLRQEKETQLRGGIYHRTQVELTYNSNHIEGSRLTEEQTRLIFETNTLGITTENTRIDDIIETVNHFHCIDYIIDHATDHITEHHIKHLHRLLKHATSDSRKEWFAVGDYKRLPNEVGGLETTAPDKVAPALSTLIKHHYAKHCITLDDVLDFHVQFERIHPFQDGNGRIGRLLLFWQCLHAGIVPFIITEPLRLFYYRGLQEWGRTNGFLQDTCLTAQDQYKRALDYFKIAY